MNDLTSLSVATLKEDSILITNPIVNNIEIKGLTKNVDKIEVLSFIGQSLIEISTNGAFKLNLDASALFSRGLFS